jgi:hypothetical protein
MMGKLQEYLDEKSFEVTSPNKCFLGDVVLVEHVEEIVEAMRQSFQDTMPSKDPVYNIWDYGNPAKYFDKLEKWVMEWLM